jgi:hypothetical protein
MLSPYSLASASACHSSASALHGSALLPAVSADWWMGHWLWKGQSDASFHTSITAIAVNFINFINFI